MDRMFWVGSSEFWKNWRNSLQVVRPETVVSWHRQGFRRFWAWKSRRRRGRPMIETELRDLIRRMSVANPLWGAPRIHGELQHAPPLYELALGSRAWHHVEHACFFASAMLFWRPVILAWPGRSPWPRWTMIPYLVLADLQNTILAAILTFSDRVIYPAYAIVPTASPSAFDDQATAGVIMWIPGSVIFLIAAARLAIETLDGARTAPGPAAVGAVHRAGRARSS